MTTQKMTLCLWFDNQAEEAAKFYTSIFKNSKIGSVSRYGKEGYEFHKKPEGTAMVVSFKLNDLDFMALNGGPQFKFTEAISIVVNCENQEEIDHYWNKLTEGGQEDNCGWLKDKYGVSWQIVPSILGKLMSNPEKSGKVMQAFLKMKKFDIEKLQNA
ncbi:MAG: VOC family protein [Bacteroidota bacterium]|nr:VOC family protein [Bacteroidota bacterium]